MSPWFHLRMTQGIISKDMCWAPWRIKPGSTRLVSIPCLMDLCVEMLLAFNFSKHSGKIWLSFVGDELEQPQKHSEEGPQKLFVEIFTTFPHLEVWGDSWAQEWDKPTWKMQVPALLGPKKPKNHLSCPQTPEHPSPGETGFHPGISQSLKLHWTFSPRRSATCSCWNRVSSQYQFLLPSPPWKQARESVVETGGSQGWSRKKQSWRWWPRRWLQRPVWHSASGITG